MTIKFSTKQIAILKVIKDKRPDGEHCDVYDIIDALPWDIKRDALLHAIRVLVEAGLVQRLPRVKRPTRVGTVTPFMVTASGYASV